eukprot:TRINITY_DN1775_c0_g1_i3.p1 TRINITY_DN1775_c0_g1~~TRINITY_DN1775_c0_g1_i3.p1  ORF type:complete len:452 (-),score=179.35 TRINITY_DN1775_c0_g1_i3:78-1397(-)
MSEGENSNTNSNPSTPNTAGSSGANNQTPFTPSSTYGTPQGNYTMSRDNGNGEYVAQAFDKLASALNEMTTQQREANSKQQSGKLEEIHQQMVEAQKTIAKLSSDLDLSQTSYKNEVNELVQKKQSQDIVMDTLKEEKDRSLTRLDALQKDLTTARSELAATKDKLTENERSFFAETADLKKKYEVAESNLSELRKANHKLEEEKSQLQNSLEREQSQHQNLLVSSKVQEQNLASEREQKNNLLETKKNMEEKITALQEERGLLQGKLAEIKQSQKTETELKQEYETEIAELKSQLEAERAEKVELRDANNQAIQKAQFDEQKRGLEAEKTARLDRENKELRETVNELQEKLRHQIKLLEERTVQYEDERSHRNSLEAYKAGAEERYNSLEDKRKGLEEAKNSLDHDLTIAQKELQQLREDRVKLDTQVSRNEKKRESE